MKIAILCATFWEIRAFLKRNSFRKKSADTYESADGNVAVVLSGMGQAKARKAAEEISRARPTLVFSTGFAGALQSEVLAGDLVFDGSRSDPAILEELLEAAGREGLKFHKGTFWSGDSVLRSVREKSDTGLRTGALACEMESQAVFEVMEQNKIPFCSFRAVSDEIGQNLPPAVSKIGESGNLGGFLKEALLHPGQWRNLLRLARSSGKAEKNLAKILRSYLCKQKILN